MVKRTFSRQLELEAVCLVSARVLVIARAPLRTICLGESLMVDRGGSVPSSALSSGVVYGE
jgi:hypothetical protein